MDISGKTAIVTGTEATVDRPTRGTGPKLGCSYCFPKRPPNPSFCNGIIVIEAAVDDGCVYQTREGRYHV